jgi:hypothetical protein
VKLPPSMAVSSVVYIGRHGLGPQQEERRHLGCSSGGRSVRFLRQHRPTLKSEPTG